MFNSTLCDEEVLGNGGIGPQILTSIQDGTACPDSFTSGETATGTNWIEIKSKSKGLLRQAEVVQGVPAR